MGTRRSGIFFFFYFLRCSELVKYITQQWKILQEDNNHNAQSICHYLNCSHFVSIHDQLQRKSCSSQEGTEMIPQRDGGSTLTPPIMKAQ